MFGQMRKRSRPGPPCPCGGKCDCHRPTDDRWLVPLILLGLAALVLVIVVCGQAKAPVRHIMVDGKQCTVHWVTDHCTSTGACSGHDEAICP
jgi:hypothetical protein